MIKKIWIIGLILLISVMITGAYFLIGKKFETREDPFTAVPQEAAIIFELPDFLHFVKKLREENNIWKEIRRIKNIRLADTEIHFLDSLIRSDRYLLNLFSGNPLLISFHLTGKNNIQPLFLINIKGKLSRAGYLQSIRK